MSKIRYFPGLRFGSSLCLYNACSKTGCNSKNITNHHIDSQNTRPQSLMSQDIIPMDDQKKKKGINGLLGSLFLREPSGSAFAKAQAQHKLYTKPKSTAPKTQEKQGTSAKSSKASPSASVASRPSISSTSMSSNNSNP